MLSTQTQEEEGWGLKEDVRVVVGLETITKIKIMQKMEVMVEEEEATEEGRAIEAKVDGNKGITIPQIVFKDVAK